MGRAVIAIAFASAILAGCASLVTPADQNGPVRRALSEPVDTLTEAADRGDRPALYALSFLAKFGLRGVEQDTARAIQLRDQAARPTSMMITQYSAGLNGAAGRTALIPVNMPGINAMQAQRMDLCGLAVMAQITAGVSFCGSAEAYAALAPAAAIARTEGGPPRMFSPAAVDPATVTQCEDVSPLWQTAVQDFSAGDGDIATDATERIIALCGDGEASWHARVMRALIAVSDEEPTVAITLLKPLPRPAPAPIGGYVSFVAMQAQAALGDWPAYRTERDTVLRASLSALGKEPGTQAVGDPFEAGETRVQIFRRPSSMGLGLDAVMVALALPSGEQDGPRTFYLTTSADIMAPSKRAYFLVEYRCDGRSTLRYFGAMNAPPEATVVRALIEQRLNGELDAASGSSFNRGISACQFPAQVAPGLGDR